MSIRQCEPEVSFEAVNTLSNVFQTQVVIHRVAQFLFASKVMLGGLNGCMAKQELNVLKFSPGQVAESCAGAAEVMRSEILDVGACRSRFDDVPDGFRCQAVARDLFLSAYSPKDCTLTYLSCSGPLIDSALSPHRNWNCANVLSFANQIGDHPVLLADLKIFHPESYH